jgi:hypothetical protein
LSLLLSSAGDPPAAHVNSPWLETFPSEGFLFQQNLGMPTKAVAPAALGRAVKPAYFTMVGLTVTLSFFGQQGHCRVSGQSPSGWHVSRVTNADVRQSSHSFAR